jgi:hypothetical protein
MDWIALARDAELLLVRVRDVMLGKRTVAGVSVANKIGFISFTSFTAPPASAIT